MLLQDATRLFLAGAIAMASASAEAQSPAPVPSLVGTSRVATSVGTTKGTADLAIFGPRLGEAIRLPTCEVRSDIVVNRPCHTGRAPTVHGYFSFPEFPEGDDEVRYGDRPSWARSGDVGATLRGGLPVAVEILADGGPALRRALLAKYGPEVRATAVEFTTDSGAKWTADELEWRLPDVHVQFTLARYGQAQGEAHGTLRIELDSLRREQEKKAQQRAALSAKILSPR
jgi:hypothetical protein